MTSFEVNWNLLVLTLDVQLIADILTATNAVFQGHNVSKDHNILLLRCFFLYFSSPSLEVFREGGGRCLLEELRLP